MNDLISQAHPEWHDVLRGAVSQLSPQYLKDLAHSSHWLPRLDCLFAAFSLPLSSTRFILLGESPYPRAVSANGYAFWDNAVGSLWSEKGLSKEVNRATSLRNFMKMLLVARGSLHHDLTQDAIAQLDKSALVHTATELFRNMMSQGFLLLNASLVYSLGEVNKHAREWRPFMKYLLEWLACEKPLLQLVLWGKIADQIPKTSLPIGLQAEHPYNLSFMTNPKVIQFFNPLDILKHHE